MNIITVCCVENRFGQISKKIRENESKIKRKKRNETKIEKEINGQGISGNRLDRGLENRLLDATSTCSQTKIHFVKKKEK